MYQLRYVLSLSKLLLTCTFRGSFLENVYWVLDWSSEDVVQFSLYYLWFPLLNEN